MGHGRRADVGSWSSEFRGETPGWPPRVTGAAAMTSARMYHPAESVFACFCLCAHSCGCGFGFNVTSLQTASVSGSFSVQFEPWNILLVNRQFRARHGDFIGYILNYCILLHLKPILGHRIVKQSLCLHITSICRIKLFTVSPVLSNNCRDMKGF